MSLTPEEICKIICSKRTATYCVHDNFQDYYCTMNEDAQKISAHYETVIIPTILTNIGDWLSGKITKEKLAEQLGLNFHDLYSFFPMDNTKAERQRLIKEIEGHSCGVESCAYYDDGNCTTEMFKPGCLWWQQFKQESE